MHLYAMTRGQKDCVDKMINDLQAQYFTYKSDPHTKEPSFLFMGVRPVQLWEFTFPKEHIQEVLATLDAGRFSITDKRKCVRLAAWILKLARFFGLKPVPEQVKGTPKKLIRKEFVDIKLIGIKEDQDAKIELI